ncbi:hypothetical protein V8E55_002328 [Tylopilus felleus]
MAYMVKEKDTPAELYINTNQTQVVYAQGANLTWTKCGAKQVVTISEDEKCAFMVIVSISCFGKLLPLQLIYQGVTTKSCPRSTAVCYDKCVSHGFQFECSKTDTYWSTQKTMASLVDNVITPYFNAEKKALGLPPTQKAICQIDIWSVHCSEKFWLWMKKHHPTIIIQFVLRGCIGVLQPCDVVIQ